VISTRAVRSATRTERDVVRRRARPVIGSVVIAAPRARGAGGRLCGRAGVRSGARLAPQVDRLERLLRDLGRERQVASFTTASWPGLLSQ
jgi:hypothetical protein